MPGASLRAEGLRYMPGLQCADLAIAAGEHVALIGPNGAGKTTLLRLLGGLLPPEAGRVFLDDTPMQGLSRSRIARMIAWLSQSDAPAADMAVQDYISLGRLPFRGIQSVQSDTEAIATAIKRTNVGSLLHRTFRDMSGGEKQRVMLARCLAQSPQILLLDEPTNHLDLKSRAELFALLRTLPLTIIAIIHDLNFIPDFAERTVLMTEGRVVLDASSRDVLFSAQLSNAFGLEIEEFTRRNGQSMLVCVPVLPE
ncbi:ABC transporter Fe3+ transport fbpC [Komagataeibacter xylinus NBRC 13693]|uniref:ABC transporter Fe3+ transport fbpC n=1 Tax=Komagataeibacter xylinus NBRC 13693 TaxID=1234668 RepID=A0A0D6QAG2_KOMXY|nr:ABC transporter ATP-binding protein [Komagataeibacter xylinus]GAO00410.1 ABC transporter Fe3+ transport fbpC [Komagataeibacter xylinus NBRC 13693]